MLSKAWRSQVVSEHNEVYYSIQKISQASVFMTREAKALRLTNNYNKFSLWYHLLALSIPSCLYFFKEPNNKKHSRSLWLVPEVVISLDRLLPVHTIKINDVHLLHRALVETVDGDALSIGVGAGGVEALDSTLATEGVLGLVSVEGVGAQHIFALCSEGTLRNTTLLQCTLDYPNLNYLDLKPDQKGVGYLQKWVCPSCSKVLNRYYFS